MNQYSNNTHLPYFYSRFDETLPKKSMRLEVNFISQAGATNRTHRLRHDFNHSLAREIK